MPRERTNFAPIWILVSLKVEGPEPAGPRDRVAKKSLRAAQADEANRNRYHAPKFGIVATFSCSGKHCAIPLANLLTLLLAIKQY